MQTPFIRNIFYYLKINQLDRIYYINGIKSLLLSWLLFLFLVMFLHWDGKQEVITLVNENVLSLLFHMYIVIIVVSIIYCLIKTKKTLYITIPIQALLVYFLIRYWFIGIMVLSGNYI